jgi:hypothetical protein
LTPLCEGIDVENSGISAVGDDPGSPVAMTAGGAVANTLTTTGHYLYLYNLTVHHADANQIYTVELIKNGTSVDTLYVQQGASPNVDSDHVHLTFDIGTSLQSWVYEIKVTEYS